MTPLDLPHALSSWARAEDSPIFITFSTVNQASGEEQKTEILEPHECPTFRRPSWSARGRDWGSTRSEFTGLWKMSQPQTPTPNNSNHNHQRNIRKDSTPPLHSIPSRSLFPSLHLADLSPLRHDSRPNSTRLGQINRRDRDFQIRIEGICRVLVTSLERNTIFRRDWEGFGSFFHLELECGSRLRFLGFFHGFCSRENALAVWGAIDEKPFLVVEKWYVVLIMRLLHLFSLTWLPFACNALETRFLAFLTAMHVEIWNLYENCAIKCLCSCFVIYLLLSSDRDWVKMTMMVMIWCPIGLISFKSFQYCNVFLGEWRLQINNFIKMAKDSISGEKVLMNLMNSHLNYCVFFFGGSLVGKFGWGNQNLVLPVTNLHFAIAWLGENQFGFFIV